MLARKNDHRDNKDKNYSQQKNRDDARFKAALKIMKNAPGHKDRPHTSHNDKRT